MDLLTWHPSTLSESHLDPLEKRDEICLCLYNPISRNNFIYLTRCMDMTPFLVDTL